MISFIVLGLVITAIILMLLLRPLFKTGDSTSFERQTQNIHFAKQRLMELDEQLQNGTISSENHASLTSEIESNLAQDIDLNNGSNEETPIEQEKSNAVIITLLCTLIPFAGLFVYQITGTPEAINLEPAQAINHPTTAGRTQNLQEIDEMVKSVEQRLLENPEDVQGWSVLAKTYLALGRYQESIDANLKLLAITGDNADTYTQLADASALLAKGNLNGKPSEYIQRALQINPQQPQALWLAGLSAAQSGLPDQARNYWNQLMPLLASSPQQQQELREIMQQSLDPEVIQEKTANDQIDNKQQDKQVADHVIKVSVSLANNLTALAKPTDTVFVFAKAKDGPPAPLAVKRLRVSDLPTTVSLSDSDAMVPQFKLSLFADLLISARIAKSGNPIAQPGDLQSETLSSTNDNNSVINIVISRVFE